jgi:hypothetical protein
MPRFAMQGFVSGECGIMSFSGRRFRSLYGMIMPLRGVGALYSSLLGYPWHCWRVAGCGGRVQLLTFTRSSQGYKVLLIGFYMM